MKLIPFKHAFDLSQQTGDSRKLPPVIRISLAITSGKSGSSGSVTPTGAQRSKLTNQPNSLVELRKTSDAFFNTEDHNRFASTDVRGIQDRCGPCYNAAAEERGLGKRKLLGYDSELVLVDERAFGETAQPEALEQADPITTQTRGVGRSPQR